MLSYLTKKEQFKDFIHVTVLQKFGPYIISCILKKPISELDGVIKDRKHTCLKTGKFIEFDFLYETKDLLIIIEWSNYDFSDQRILYYNSCALSDQLNLKENYNKIKPVVLILLDASKKCTKTLISGDFDCKAECGLFHLRINFEYFIKFTKSDEDSLVDNPRLLNLLKIIVDPVNVKLINGSSIDILFREFSLDIMEKRKRLDTITEDELSPNTLKVLKKFRTNGTPTADLAKALSVDENSMELLFSHLGRKVLN